MGGSLELCSQRVVISNIPAKHTCKVSPSSFMLDTMSTHAATDGRQSPY